MQIEMTERPVTLEYPGAEGVRFHDAVLTLKDGAGSAGGPLALNVRIDQGGRELYSGEVGAEDFDALRAPGPGGEARVSLFRLMQKKVSGFGSRVNMFGYKAVLDWAYEVSVAPPGGEPKRWMVRWSPSAEDEKLVEVSIGDG